MTRRRLPSPDKRRGSRLGKRGYRRRGVTRGGGKTTKRGLAALKVGLVFIGVVSLFAIAIFGFRMFRQRIWDGRGRITFALQMLEVDSDSADVYVVSYLPNDERLSVVSFPREMKIETVGGYGLWKVDSIYPLGELEGSGGELLRRSLGQFLGVAIDGWLVLDVGGVEINRDNVRSFVRAALGKSILGGARTNFSYWDVVKVWKGIGSVRIDHIDFVDLGRIGVLDEQLQPDGSRVFVVLPERLDEIAQRLFLHPQIISERLTFSVVNSTNHRGLGQRASRIIKNTGGDVVSVSDTSEPLELTTITVTSKELLESYSVKKLAQIFAKAQAKVGDTASRRADVIVTVGEDYWKDLVEF